VVTGTYLDRSTKIESIINALELPYIPIVETRGFTATSGKRQNKGEPFSSIK